MILLLHHRYRFAGGEERAVADLEGLIRSHLGDTCDIDVTAFPLEGLGGQSGALAIFWERAS